MKNNIAMNFLNHIANLEYLSDERCNRTGQDYRDGRLWHIDAWRGIMTDSIIDDNNFFGEETYWRFSDGSLIVCSGDPTDFEYTEDIRVRYYGTLGSPGVPEGARTFVAGCSGLRSGEGYFYQGVYTPLLSILPVPEEPKVEVVQPKAQVSTAEIATNHEAAVEYLATRKENAKAVLDSLTWTTVNNVRSSILYLSCKMTRFEEGNAHWARAEMEGRTPVLFASEECFLAWVLRRFW